jgi:hypothetical protein
MSYSEDQLRQIAQGRKLHFDTKGFFATVIVLGLLQAIFQWEAYLLTGIFAVGGVVSYARTRLDAISYFVFGGTVEGGTEERLS